MDANPVLKPKLATPALIMSSAAVAVCCAYVVGNLFATWPPDLLRGLATAVFLLSFAVVGMVWRVRARRLRVWVADTTERWNNFNDMKRSNGTTAEVTVLSVDSLEPTGSWITVKWNRFDHIQRAWIEALHDPIWPGSILLISPDPGQVRPGAPWPTMYFIHASHFLAWAPPK